MPFDADKFTAMIAATSLRLTDSIIRMTVWDCGGIPGMKDADDTIPIYDESGELVEVVVGERA